jgi:acetyl-CoA carboxylase carboxyl transferase subunit beta
LEALLADAVELGPHDAGVVVRFGALRPSGVRVAVVAQDASGEGRILTDGFRLAVRAFETAGRLGLPVVVLVDTRGADPLPASEADGVAAAIARTFVAALDCPTPTLAVVTGEGGSGGALSMAACDRVVAWEHAVFSVIAPEGAASILYRDGSRAPELAERLRITAPDLVELGLADGLVPEPAGGAHTDPPAAAAGLAAAVAQHLDEIIATPNPARLAHRRRRWRRAGNRWLRPGRGS